MVGPRPDHESNKTYYPALIEPNVYEVYTRREKLSIATWCNLLHEHSAVSM